MNEEEQWAKIKTERIFVYWEGLFRKNTELLQHRLQQNLNFHREDRVSTKTALRELHKSNIHGRSVIAEPLITESNAQMCQRWCHDHKAWTSDNCKRARDMVRWVVLHAVLYIRKSLRSEITQGSIQSGMSDSNSETRLGSNIVVFCWSFISKVLQGGTWSNYFRTTMQFSYTTMSPFTQLELFSHGLKSMMMNFNISLVSTITKFEHHWTTLVTFWDYSEEQIPTSKISKPTWRCS
jgi:hypothetical protein